MTDAIITCSEHFTDLALNELQRHHSKLDCIQAVTPSHLHIRNTGSFSNLTRPWKHKLPIYLHYCFPLQRTIPLENSPSDFAILRQTAHELTQEPFTVQVYLDESSLYPERGIIHTICPAQNQHYDTTKRGRVLSVLIANKTAYMGLSWAGQNLSPFVGGKPYFTEPVPNRAGHKLLEALQTFNIHLPTNSRVLDLGAAPGAWTEVLRRRGLRVTAVAPREMYPWLQCDPLVESHFMTAESYLARCPSDYDLIVNDMRLDARDSARLMVDYAQHLRSDGLAIMTLKLRMSQPRRLMDHAFRILRKTYKIIHVRQLVYNRKEVTLYLRRKH